MLSRRLDVGATRCYIFHSHSCLVGDDADEARGVNVSVSGASGSHSLTFITFPTLPGVQGTHPFWGFLFALLFIDYFKKHGIYPTMLWSHVSLKGLIQHASLRARSLRTSIHCNV